MSRYKIIVQYDGSCFSGWQLQKEKKTVQGEIENALKVISGTKTRVPVYGAGRTDAGVHAYGQVAHFDLNTKLSTVELCNAINSQTSKKCKIMLVEEISSDFEARFNAIKRCYRYQVYTGNSILYRNQAWLINDIDLDLLKSLSEIILGEHDFLSFSKFSDKKNNLCKIFMSKWVFDDKKDKKLSYIIHGDRFLHHMVRYLVGTMIAVSQNKISIEDFKNLLNLPRKDAKIFKAPSKGLVLKEIFYEN